MFAMGHRLCLPVMNSIILQIQISGANYLLTQIYTCNQDFIEQETFYFK